MPQPEKSATSLNLYSKLKDDILHLKYPPGTAISEIETAKQFELSRTPVRDAFKLLENDGLLEIQPHKGTFISLIDLNKISDILFMRETIEQAILKDLVYKYDKSQEFRIRLVLQKQKQLLESDIPTDQLSREFIKSDNEFHDTLFAIDGKINVIEYLHMIFSEYERFRTFLNLGEKENIIRLYNEHEQIFQCIANRDLDKLQNTLSHHLYDGFNSSADIIYKYPDYFRPIDSRKNIR